MLEAPHPRRRGSGPKAGFAGREALSDSPGRTRKGRGDGGGKPQASPHPKRRGRDLNPRSTFQHLRDFQSRSFGRSDTSPGADRVARMCGLLPGDRGDVGRHVGDLLLGELVERGHHALAVRDAVDDELRRGLAPRRGSAPPRRSRRRRRACGSSRSRRWRTPPCPRPRRPRPPQGSSRSSRSRWARSPGASRAARSPSPPRPPACPSPRGRRPSARSAARRRRARTRRVASGIPAASSGRPSPCTATTG